MSAPIFPTVGDIATSTISDHDLIALGPAGGTALNAEFYDRRGRLLALVGPFSDEQIARYKLADYAMAPRDTLTSTEAAWLLRVDQSHIRRLCGGGTLDATLRGRDWAISAASVLNYRRNRPTRTGRPRKDSNPAF